jgi:DNA-binding PadR family transcriptional regulator
MPAAADDTPAPNPTEFHILLALAAGDLHGYAIMREVEAASAGAVRLGPGTLYGAIKRMRRAGWIEETPIRTRKEDEPDPRRRCNYRLTRTGRKAASAAARRLADLLSTAQQRGLVSP